MKPAGDITRVFADGHRGDGGNQVFSKEGAAPVGMSVPTGEGGHRQAGMAEPRAAAAGTTTGAHHGATANGPRASASTPSTPRTPSTPAAPRPGAGAAPGAAVEPSLATGAAPGAAGLVAAPTPRPSPPSAEVRIAHQQGVGLTAPDAKVAGGAAKVFEDGRQGGGGNQVLVQRGAAPVAVSAPTSEGALRDGPAPAVVASPQAAAEVSPVSFPTGSAHVRAEAEAEAEAGAGAKPSLSPAALPVGQGQPNQSTHAGKRSASPKHRRARKNQVAPSAGQVPDTAMPVGEGAEAGERRQQTQTPANRLVVKRIGDALVVCVGGADENLERWLATRVADSAPASGDGS